MGNKVGRTAVSTSNSDNIVLSPRAAARRNEILSAAAQPQTPSSILRPSAPILWADIAAMRPSTHLRRFTSAQQVFDVFDLCEMIFRQLDPLDLVRMQQTKLFLRAAAEYRPWTAEAYIGVFAGSMIEAVLHNFCAARTPFQIPACQTASVQPFASGTTGKGLVTRWTGGAPLHLVGPYSIDGLCTRGRCGGALHVAASMLSRCRAMFLFQPSIKEVYIEVFKHNESLIFNISTLWPEPDYEPMDAVIVRRDTGVTSGDIVDAFHAAVGTHSQRDYHGVLRFNDGFAVTIEEMNYMEEHEEMHC